MKELDARGFSCPLPLMHTKKAIEDAPAEILVLVDDGTAKANVTGFLTDSGYAVSVETTADEYRITGVKE